MQDPRQVEQIKKAVEDELLKRPGVTGVDVGYKYVDGKKTDEIALRVHVAEKKDVPPDQKIPETINGVRTDVLQNKFVLHPVSMLEQDIRPEVDSNTYDPLQGGISIGPCRAVNGSVFAGTLGAIVFDNVSNAPMMLSNFHVMAVDNEWRVGDIMVQPSRIEGGSCLINVVGSLQRTALGEEVDCAVASITARDSTNQIVDIGPITGTANAELGMAIRKRGRTTGLTFGFIDSIALTISLDYGNGIHTKTLRNQIGVMVDSTRSAVFGDHGDSGSVIVDDKGRIIGLYFAGSDNGTMGTANPIQSVLDVLNINIGNLAPASQSGTLYSTSLGPRRHRITKLW